jgi:phage regulator Rha-like protein
MSELVIMQQYDVFTTSLIIAENLDLKHENVIKLIKKYSYVDNLRVVQTRKVSTKGRAIVEHLLTEEQALILVSLMKNTEPVIKFKIGLVQAFIKYRKLSAQLLAQKNSADWLEKRRETKVMRRECTDKIQKFVEYAKAQGSKSAEKYYMSLTRMELTGLFIIEQKYPNHRDVMSMRQLNLIEMADEVIGNALEDGMNQGLPYKECYVLAKERISQLARLFPPSPLPMLLADQSS